MADTSYRIEWGARIPMRDGIHLNATLYLPADLAGPVPAIFTLTPYISDSYHERGAYFAANGFVFALVDVRGRGNSAGDFRFAGGAADGPDGYDICAWLAGQPWCNGKVAMWGGSYAGENQWAVARQHPPSLATIVPAAAAQPGVDFPALNNIYYAYDIQWRTFTSGLTPNANLFAADAFWLERFRELYDRHRPFRELDQVVGNPSPMFQAWLDRPTPAHWSEYVLTPDDYTGLDLPILTITGHYDDDQPGALAYYRRHMRHGSESARAKHYLIIGPWDHAGTRTPQASFGGLTFDAASLLNLNEIHKEWYAWTMGSGARPAFLQKRVAYYVMGAECWKYADSLEDIPTERRCLYLDSDGSADDAFHSGRLVDAPPAGSPPDRYRYDPLDTRPGALDAANPFEHYTDQRRALNLFGAGLVYHSAPFEQATEITGSVSLSVWLALDAPDTDFEVTLYEIQLDGTSIRLTHEWKRARYRQSLDEAKLVPPGEVLRYDFETFPFFSRLIQPHSRLRLVIRAPNTPHIQKNYNSGGDVSAETAADARTVTVTLCHDADHPSCLEIPVAAG